jgi:hypothetical protein
MKRTRGHESRVCENKPETVGDFQTKVPLEYSRGPRPAFFYSRGRTHTNLRSASQTPSGSPLSPGTHQYLLYNENMDWLPNLGWYLVILLVDYIYVSSKKYFSNLNAKLIYVVPHALILTVAIPLFGNFGAFMDTYEYHGWTLVVAYIEYALSFPLFVLAANLKQRYMPQTEKQKRFLTPKKIVFFALLPLLAYLFGIALALGA